MPRRVLLNFMRRICWCVHFIEEDCRTPVAPSRYYHFECEPDLRTFVVRCNPAPDDLAGFDRAIEAWGQGSIFVTLRDEQYAALQRPRTRLRPRS